MERITQLHWSFNYDNRHQIPYYVEQLEGALQQLDTLSEKTEPLGHIVDHYTILPNFWRGYKGRVGETADGYDLTIGEIVVDRRREETGNWRYAVRSMNTISGEDLRLDFRCAGDDYRALINPWHVMTENHAEDDYQRFECSGNIHPQEDGLQVALTMNGVVLNVGRVEPSIPLTCNWALFDVIPAVSGGLKNSIGMRLCWCQAARRGAGHECATLG